MFCVSASSSSGDYLLTGASNGCVRVHPLPHPYSLTSLHSYWALSMHDNHYGAVTQLATTFDGRYVVSAGADGNVFVYSANLPMATNRVLSTEVAKVVLCSCNLAGLESSSSLPPTRHPLSPGLRRQPKTLRTQTTTGTNPTPPHTVPPHPTPPHTTPHCPTPPHTTPHLPTPPTL